jgi:anhydro-N-acetylmuramic acid kinase
VLFTQFNFHDEKSLISMCANVVFYLTNPGYNKLKNLQKMRIAGVMSGTSGDGLDIAICTFSTENNRFEFNLEHAQTIEFPTALRKKLLGAHLLSALALHELDREFGHFIGNTVLGTGFPVELISSHGHTVFHQPSKGFSVQIGHGACIAASSGVPVVCDFRSNDTALGGQGAPLVPVGDALLFSAYDGCLNLGGICNISVSSASGIRAWDITFCNIILNHYANKLGFEYDPEGSLAAKGRINQNLFEQLNQLDFIRKTPPKSLGREWIESDVLPLFEKHSLEPMNALATATAHVAHCIGLTVQQQNITKLLVTGGGAFNSTLIQSIRQQCKAEVVIPSKEIIGFKEAIVFGLLGYLRWNGEINVWQGVTGAKKSTSSGAIYLP